MKSPLFDRSAVLLGVMVLSALTACSGGGGSGVGSGGSGMDPGYVQGAGQAQGTVSGFGSVIVDGERYDDRQAQTVQEVEPGVDKVVTVQLGQGVEVRHDNAGVAQQVRVSAAVSGKVSAVNSIGMSVLGQTVIFNVDGMRGPVTQWGGGYVGPTSIKAGDVVEIHGVPLRQGSLVSLQATRVDHVSAQPKYVLVSGPVSMLSGSSFRLGGLQVDAGVGILPAGVSLANEQIVTVLATPNNFMESTGMPRLVPSQIRVKTLGSTGSPVALSGAISDWDAVVGRFSLGGFKVVTAGASVVPSGKSLSNGSYVRVNGRVLADGALQALTITLRDGSVEPEAELHGTVRAYQPSNKTFQVRGVSVNASGAVVAGCTGGIAEGSYVEVEGVTNATGVLAKSVHCEMEPAGATVGRTGVASAVNVTDLSFTLTPAKGEAVKVRWSNRTYFESLSSTNLAGKRLEVEGTLVNGVLNAQHIAPGD